MIDSGNPDGETSTAAIGMVSLLALDGLTAAERPGHSVVSIESLLHRRVLYGQHRYLANRVLPPADLGLQEGVRSDRLPPAVAAWVREQQLAKRLISSPATDHLVQRLAERLAADVGCQRLLQHGEPDAVIRAEDFRYDRQVVAHVDWLIRQPTHVTTVELRSVDDLSRVTDILRSMHYCRRVAWSRWLISQEMTLPLTAVVPVILAVERRGENRVRLLSFTAADLAEADRRNQDALERLVQPHEPHPMMTVVTDPFGDQIPHTAPLVIEMLPAQRRESHRDPPSIPCDDRTSTRPLNGSRPMTSDGISAHGASDPSLLVHLEPASASEPVAVMVDESIDPEGTDVFGPLDLGTPRRRHHGDALDRIVTEHGESG